MREVYPSDWPEISRRVRFERAGGICQGCGRPHGMTIRCLPDGRWFDSARHTWRNGRGRPARWPDLEDAAQMRQTRVILAAAHLDHDPRNNRWRNLKSLCQRCHISTIARTIWRGGGLPICSAGPLVICSWAPTQPVSGLRRRRRVPQPINRPMPHCKAGRCPTAIRKRHPHRQPTAVDPIFAPGPAPGLAGVIFCETEFTWGLRRDAVLAA